MLPDQATSLMLDPPTRTDTGFSDWFVPAGTQALEEYLSLEILGRDEPVQTWQVARLSSAAYVYRETKTEAAVVAKFYTVKTGRKAAVYSNRELHYTRLAREVLSAEDSLRVVDALSVYRGVLLLEHIEGLTLEDTIAIRRSHPGIMLPALERVADLMARLHVLSVREQEAPDFDPAVEEAQEIVQNLSKHGVLRRRPFLRRKLSRLIDRWASDPTMVDYTPCLIHGDATTTNFVFPQDGSVVAIDWERAKATDPAADLGRLLAEVSHCVAERGGTVEETNRMIAALNARYCKSLATSFDEQALLSRARFYFGSSTLRIARNGWLSRPYRMALVGKAVVLLSPMQGVGWSG